MQKDEKQDVKSPPCIVRSY